MRVTRVSLLGTVSLVLVGSLSAVVSAHDEELAPITSVTGTVVEHYGCEFSDEDAGDLTSYDLRGYEVMTQTAPIHQVVEWSDPRLPTDLWLMLGYTLISTGEDDIDGAINVAWQSPLEDEQGRWRGTGRSVQGRRREVQSLRVDRRRGLRGPLGTAPRDGPG